MYIPDKGGGGEQNRAEKKVGGGRGSGGGVALGCLVAGEWKVPTGTAAVAESSLDEETGNYRGAPGVAPANKYL